MPDKNKQQLHELLSNLVDEKLSAQELKELQALLRNDPDAQQFYIKYTMLHSWLSWDYVEQSPAESRLLSLKKQEDAEQPAQSPITGFLGDVANFLNHYSPLSFVLLVVAFGMTLWAAANWFAARQVNVAPPAEPVFAAQITATKDCQWSTAITPPTEMMQLQVGQQLQLDKGIAQVTYCSGAVVLLEGPASFTVGSANSGFLSQGRLTARAESAESREFAIVTPDARFVDLGTEFGVMIDEKGHAAAAVFKGKVKAEAKLPDGRWTAGISIREGEAVVCEAATFTRQVAQRENFPSLQPLPPPPPSYQRWLEARRELQKRKDLLVYYDFQPEVDGPSVLVNRAPSGPALDGEIHNATWVDGRFTGKRALEFMSGDSGVRINIPGEYRQLTLIAWLSSQGLANDRNGILLSDGWLRRQELHWQFLKTGQIHLHLSVFGQVQPGISTKSIPSDSLKQWCMVAGVVNSALASHYTYLNGEFFEAIRAEQMPAVQIGWATIGGWDNEGHGDSDAGKVCNLSGRIDELMIFDRALGSEEIKQIYENGKP
jgi:hypothetical protein